MTQPIRTRWGPLAVAILLTAACQPDRRVIERAELAFNVGDLDSAKAKYESFITEYPLSQWRDLADRQLTKTNALIILTRQLDEAADLLRSSTPYNLPAAERVYFTGVRLAREIAVLHSTLIDTTETIRSLDFTLDAIAVRVAEIQTTAEYEVRARAIRQRERNRIRTLRTKIGRAVDLDATVLWSNAELHSPVGTVHGVRHGDQAFADVAIVREMSPNLQAARITLLKTSGDTLAGWIATETLGAQLSDHLCGNRLYRQPHLIRMCRAVAPSR